MKRYLTCFSRYKLQWWGSYNYSKTLLTKKQNKTKNKQTKNKQETKQNKTKQNKKQNVTIQTPKCIFEYSKCIKWSWFIGKTRVPSHSRYSEKRNSVFDFIQFIETTVVNSWRIQQKINPEDAMSLLSERRKIIFSFFWKCLGLQKYRIEVGVKICFWFHSNSTRKLKESTISAMYVEINFT